MKFNCLRLKFQSIDFIITSVKGSYLCPDNEHSCVNRKVTTTIYLNTYQIIYNIYLLIIYLGDKYHGS